jgi:hypothetical protein
VAWTGDGATGELAAKAFRGFPSPRVLRGNAHP